MATITITVTVAGGKFVLDGVSQATYSATPGNTYKFDQSDGTNDGHPLRLSTTSDGTHNSGSAYTDGVTTSGVPGNAGAYTQIEVTATTVQTLYYYCSNHSGMGGSFNVGSSTTVNYKDTKGFNVQSKSTNPTNAIIGDLYYDTSSGELKGVQSGTASWASGGAMNTSRYYQGGFGSQSAALVFGGSRTPGGIQDLTEQYDGSSWTEVADLGQARYNMAAFGSSYTSGISAGGNPGSYNNVESWDGSSWTETTEINTGRGYLAGFGAATNAGIIAGGGPSPVRALAETWNGSSWTEVGDLNTARWGLAGSNGSPQTSGIVFGGLTPSPVAIAETWDGSSWTEVGDMNTAKNRFCGFGTSSSSAVGAGGFAPPPTTALTEVWDGSSWTETTDLSTARAAAGPAGNTTLGLAAGGTTAGGNPGVTAVTEEWSLPDFQIKTVTTS